MKILEVPPYLSVVNAATVLRNKEGIFRHEVGEAKFTALLFTCTVLRKNEKETSWVVT